MTGDFRFSYLLIKYRKVSGSDDTRNQFARKRTRVRIPSSPPLKALGIRCLFSFFEFKQRAKEEPQVHLETIPLLFIALMPAYTPQVVFAVALSLFSASHPAR